MSPGAGENHIQSNSFIDTASNYIHKCTIFSVLNTKIAMQMWKVSYTTNIPNSGTRWRQAIRVRIRSLNS